MITIAPQYTKRYYDWTSWKAVPSVKNFVYQYDNDGTVYTIWGYDGPEVHICNIWLGTIPYTNTVYTQAQNDIDKSDFETNFLSTANAALGDLNTSDGLKNGLYANLVLTTANTAYEVKVGASRLTNRKCVTITALDDMYYGFDNSVTASTGTPLRKNQSISFSIKPQSSLQIWVVASANSKNARITELA